MAQPKFKGVTEEKRRYLVVVEVESDMMPPERPDSFIVDPIRSEDFTGTSAQWHEMIEGKEGGGPRPDVEVVEICSIKDMGPADVS